MAILVVEKTEEEGGGGEHQAMEEDLHDHISDLPDIALARTLSLLYNGTHEAIGMNNLSKRWRHLWKYTDSLCFRLSPDMDESTFPNFVSRALDLHGGGHLESFGVWFNYKDEDANQVDSWIHHAITRNVRELRLNFAIRSVRSHKPYELPSCFTSIASLEELNLIACKLEIPLSSRFNSLREVYLHYVVLGGDAIKNLTSTSPCLQTLIIDNCTSVAGIHIEHPKLQSVDVDCTGDITIHTPNLNKLFLRGTILRRRCHVKDLPSSAALLLGFEEMFNLHYSETDGDRLINLLGGLRHVSKLQLDGWCIQALAISAAAGKLQQLNAVELDLQTNLKEWELPGVAYLLKNCHKLQKLIVSIDTCQEYMLNLDLLGNYDFLEQEYWKLQEMSSSCVMENLKTIEIVIFRVCNFLSAEDMENNEAEEAFKFIENEIEFIKFLLKNSVALEKMTISIIREKGFKLLQKLDPLNKDVQELLVFPRASPKAEIILL